MVTETFSNDDLFNQELIDNIIATKSYRHLAYDNSCYAAGVASDNNEYITYMTDEYGHIVYKKGYNDFSVAYKEALRLYEIMVNYIRHSSNFHELK